MTTQKTVTKLSLDEVEVILCRTETTQCLDCGSYSVYHCEDSGVGSFVLVVPVSGDPCVIR